MDESQLARLVLEELAGVVPRLDPAHIDAAISFRDQIELDSIDYLSFVLALEKRLGVRVPHADYPRLSSLQGCLDYLPSLPLAEQA